MIASAYPAALRYRVSKLNGPADDHATFYGIPPLWKTVDRIVGELLQLRAEKAALASPAGRRGTKTQANQLPLL